MKAFISEELRDLDDLVSRKDLFTANLNEADIVFVHTISKLYGTEKTVVCHHADDEYMAENVVYMPLFDGVNKNSYCYDGTQLFYGDAQRIEKVISLLKSGTHLGFKQAVRTEDLGLARKIVDLYQCMIDDLEIELKQLDDPKKAAYIIGVCGGIRVKEDFFKEEPATDNTGGVDVSPTEEDAEVRGAEVVGKEPAQPSPFAESREF